MFKKPIQVDKQTMVTGNDRLQLQNQLKEGLNKKTVEAFFKENELIQMEKLKGSKQVIYSTDNYPAFVDVNGKGLFFPTVYVVSEYPNLVEEVRVKEAVESLVLSGGNLTWEGVEDKSSLGEFKKDDVRAILNNQGKIIALGAMGSDSNNIVTSEPACYILSTVKDKLWEHGPGELIPEKPQYSRKQVEQQSEESDDDQDQLLKLVGGLKNKNAIKKGSKAPQPKQQIKTVAIEKDEDDDLNQKVSKKKGAKQEQQPSQKEKKKQVEPEEESKDGGPSIPIKVMDEYIMEAFLNSVTIGINDKALPLDAQSFFTNYMNLYKKEGIEIDWKHSTYGKVGKFFIAMAKEGLIEYKEDKKGKELKIFSIDRGHKKIDSWKPTVLKAHKQKEDDGKQQQQLQLNVQVQELYRPAGNVVVIFKKEQQTQTQGGEQQFLTKEEVKKELLEFLKAEANQPFYTQDKKNKNIYKLAEGSLLFNLFPQEIEEVDEDGQPQQKSTEEEGGPRKKLNSLAHQGVSVEIILNRVLEGMTKSHKVTSNATKKTEIKQGEFKGLVITAEKQQNTQVTTIQGLEAFGIFDPKEQKEKGTKAQEGKDQKDQKEVKETKEQKAAAENIYAYPNFEKMLAEKIGTTIKGYDLPKNGGRVLSLNGVFLEELTFFFVQEAKIDAQYVHEVNKIAAKKKEKTFEK